MNMLLKSRLQINIALLPLLLLGCALTQVAPETEPTPALPEISALAEPIPFVVCGEDAAWVRPDAEAQEPKWWRFGQ